MIEPNPFVEHSRSQVRDEDLVVRAQAGERTALEDLLRRHQAWVYNIALRMVWEPADAEDATQEVLLKVITRLSTFAGHSSFRTWLYRIVCNHVLHMKRGRWESESLTFREYGQQLDGAPDLELPDPTAVPVELPVLVEEAKIGCTMGMLLCLDRRQRLVYVLGEILAVPADVGAEVMELTPANFRQILSRARRDLHAFMDGKCGLVDSSNPCRCAHKTRAFMRAGYVDPGSLRFAAAHAQRVAEVAATRTEEIEELTEDVHGAIFRRHPFLEPADQAVMLRELLHRLEQ